MQTGPCNWASIWTWADRLGPEGTYLDLACLDVV
jgi:hypothetical protein